MNAETILSSDLLDIIFENRNKQYGAYSLRKEYSGRLYKALLIMSSALVILIAWNYLLDQMGKRQTSQVPISSKDSAIVLTQVELPKDPPANPPVQRHYSTIKNVVPTIVPDPQVTASMPTVRDLTDKVMGYVDAPGESSGSDSHSATTELLNSTRENVVAERVVEPSVAEMAEIMPEFPGGTAALLRFLGRNLRVPEAGLESGQRVKVPIRFVVNKDGNLSDVQFLSVTDNVFKNEIIRVLAKMPKWKPGLQHGKSVAVYFTIPIIFEMTEN